MIRHLLFSATALILTSGVTSAQNQPSQDKTDVPAALQSTTPDKPPIANVPELQLTWRVCLDGRLRDKHPRCRRGRETKSKLQHLAARASNQMQTEWL